LIRCNGGCEIAVRTTEAHGVIGGGAKGTGTKQANCAQQGDAK